MTFTFGYQYTNMKEKYVKFNELNTKQADHKVKCKVIEKWSEDFGQIECSSNPDDTTC